MAFNGGNNLNSCDTIETNRFLRNETIEFGYNSTAFAAVNEYDQYANKKLRDQLTYKACMTGNLNLIEELLESEYEVNEFLTTGWTLLLYAASFAQSNIIKYLLNSGADSNLHHEGYTPLMALCTTTKGSPENRIKCLKYLIEANANVNAANKIKETPLMLACKFQELDFILELLYYVDDVNFADSEQSTALFYAVSKNRYDVTQLLIERGADITWVNYHGLTAYDIAYIKGYEKLFPLLNINYEEDDEEKLQTSCITTWLDMFPSENQMDVDTIDDDVANLLYGMGLESYKSCFKGIDLKTFLRLKEYDLEKLGIDISIHRKKFIDELFKFHKHEWNSNLTIMDQSQPFSTFKALQILGNINRQLTIMSSSVYFSKNYLNSLEEIEDLNITYEDKERLNNEIKNLQTTALRIKEATNRLDNLAKAVNELSPNLSLPTHIEKKSKKNNRKWLFLTVITLAGLYFLRMKSIKKLWNKDDTSSKSWRNIFNFSFSNILYDKLYSINLFSKKDFSFS